MSEEIDRQSVCDSILLHQLCSDVGFSRKQWLAKIAHSDVDNTMMGYAGQYLDNIGSKALYSGSVSEGVAARFLGSDTDIMFVLNGTTVIEHGQTPQDNSDHTYQIIYIHHPAFVRLLMLRMGSNQDKRVLNTPRYCVVDEEGRLVLNGRELIERSGGIRNGPASTQEFELVGSCDYVYSLHCRVWPSASDEWIQRYRPFNWPSPDVIKEIMKQGCELVAVGRPTSPAPHLEWRLSSSLAERTLIRSLNIVQIQCYFLLKLILVFLIKPEVPNSLASYHMKIVILHVVENTGPQEWTRERLTMCFMRCLKLLLTYLEFGYCPQAFIPQHNLFERKVEGNVRRRLVDIVRELKQEGWKCLLRCLPFSNRQYCCQHVEPRCWCHIEYWKGEILKDKLLHNMPALCRLLCGIYSILHTCNASSSFIDNVEFYQTFISDRARNDSEQYPSLHCSVCVRKTVSCHFGYILLSASTGENAHNYRSLAPILQYAKQLLESNCDVDLTSCRLKLATFYYQTEQRERCVQTAIDVLRRYTDAVVPWCLDDDRANSHFQTERYMDRVMGLIHLFGNYKALIGRCAYPVVFSRWELPCAPTAVQELSQARTLRTAQDWEFYSLFIIDPLVYTYYLLIISEHDLGREERCRRAMMRLRHIVNNPRVYFLFYPETASFLLEYCEKYILII